MLTPDRYAGAGLGRVAIPLLDNPGDMDKAVAVFNLSISSNRKAELI